ncbi:MAG: hypothetical protein AB7F22_05410 [Reyranella sp.]|uniref:hypothetical protein n=1 Tax=Reyranella sp. TaxID=1929291 RepID=UPI003D0F987B
MAFGFNPAGNGFPSQAPEGFPNYIQFQADGTDLGNPNADTVDFVYPLIATRGAGENANKITVTTAENPSAATPVAGADDPLVLSLTGNVSAAFNSSQFSDWTGVVSRTSGDLTWDGTNKNITVEVTGLYEVEIVGRLSPDLGSLPASTSVYYGSAVNSALNALSPSLHSAVPVFGLTYTQWTDKYVFNANELPASITPALYAAAYNNESETCSFSAVVTVRRIGDAAA